MEFLQLEYFVALAKSEHLTNTAKQFMVTPSAISASVIRLEKELNCELFDRVGRRMELNQNGKAFLEYAEVILYNLGAARETLQKMQVQAPDTLSVALWHPTLYNKPVNTFRAEHPNLQFKYIIFDPEIVNDIPANRFDLFIAPIGSFNSDNWFTKIILNDEILLAVPPGHPLASKRVVDLYDLKNEKFAFTIGGSFSQYCKSLCAQAGFSPNVHFECEYTSRPNVIRNENVIGLTTYSAVLCGLYDGLPLLHLSNKPVRYLAIHWPKCRRPSKIAEQFIEHMASYFEQYNT